MRVIETSQLTLEPQTAAHADEMFRVLSDPVIYQHEGEPPSSVEELHERFARLESRRSPDGRHRWLNWVIRLPGTGLIGFVQATVHPDGVADIAYQLGSAWWGRGLARQAVELMIGELVTRYGVHRLFAVLKRENQRSLRLLQRLDFTPASSGPAIEPDELRMVRDLRST